MADLGCPIGPDGWRFALELFYLPDEVRRFGSDTFGSDFFGDYNAIDWNAGAIGDNGIFAALRCQAILDGTNDGNVVPNPAVAGAASTGDTIRLGHSDGAVYYFEVDPAGSVTWANVRPEWINGEATQGIVQISAPVPPASTPRWVDITAGVTGLQFTRGLTEPNVFQATDTVQFSYVENTGSPLVEWLPPQSLASPNINTPMRLSLIDPALPDDPQIILTCRLDSVRELHDAGTRIIDFFGYGTKTELRTLMTPPVQFNQETVAARLDRILLDIGYVDGVEPYPPEFTGTDIARDPEPRDSAAALDAYAAIHEAAATAGYYPVTASNGNIAWSNLTVAPYPDLDRLLVDCHIDGQGFYVELVDNRQAAPNQLSNAAGDILVFERGWPLTTRQLWQADTQQVLNVVQVVSRTVADSGEAIDQTSVNRWGRRNTGFGFPLLTNPKDNAAAQQLAEDILALTANRVNRVSEVAFHTLTDPLWFDVIADMEVDRSFWVRRTQPTQQDMPSSVIGYTVIISRSHIEGVLHMTTLEATT